MADDELGFESVSITFEDETIEALDRKAFAEHRDNRAAAIRDCLDEWLKRQADGESSEP